MEKIDLVAPVLPATGGIALDIGDNLHDYRAKTEKKGYTYFNLDLVGCPSVKADAHTLPVKDCSVQAVILRNVIEHLEFPEIAISEIHRVLQRDGILIMIAPFMHGVHGQIDYRRYTALGIRQLLKDFFVEYLDSPISFVTFFTAFPCALLWKMRLRKIAATLKYISRKIDMFINHFRSRPSRLAVSYRVIAKCR